MKHGLCQTRLYNWSLAHGYQSALTIDRIDNNSDYSPDNCRWVTPKAQANNRRSCRLIEFNGENHTLTEWSEKLNIDRSTLSKRICKYKWSIQKAFTVPVNTEFRSR